MACSEAGVILHGRNETQQGIPECYLLVRELEKCKAGGLPPPASIPDEVELRRRDEAAKAAAAAEALAKADELAFPEKDSFGERPKRKLRPGKKTGKEKNN